MQEGAAPVRSEAEAVELIVEAKRPNIKHGPEKNMGQQQKLSLLVQVQAGIKLDGHTIDLTTSTNGYHLIRFLIHRCVIMKG